MTIDQCEIECYLMPLLTQDMSIIFPMWIYNMIQNYSGEWSWPLDLVAPSVAAQPHWSLLRLLLRTDERSNCDKSSFHWINQALRWSACQVRLRNIPKILVLGPYLCTRIWMCVMICLLKMPLSICQSRWKEIQNTLLVIFWVCWEPRTRILVLLYRCR